MPRPLKGALTGCMARTVREMGWDGQQNGTLLRSMANVGVQVFVTMDRNLMYQQNLVRLAQAGMTVVVLRARSNRLVDLLPLLPELQGAISAREPGQIVHLATQRDD